LQAQWRFGSVGQVDHRRGEFGRVTSLGVVEERGNAAGFAGWDEKEGFDRFVEQRLVPAGEAIGLDREMTIAVTPLHDFFAPRLTELPTLRASLPGAPKCAP
jgi:hypothetical protein